ncbi:tripartite tricarboxylate transporter TctB family protein [Amylibacter sp. IMCC11727]|uniref:tripartite tricarboxylate transporter TctB family protein n=1 Tax=Amylibacter sp. IMCC11727 TaxID=3039851 RepID=UPI00244DA2DA|nr:tripartite tricarboxylate transporter TctB family protein [Amylibacter sp. IMCC11727]WGI22409.1 tripartite tricarboxylate transporter TctB family protein [Amylibacter sp. IMCC11727]
MNRLEHAIPAGIIMAVGLWVAWVSYTQTPAEAFVFPRLVSTVFVVLSVWTFATTLIKPSEGSVTISAKTWMNILPGLIIGGIFAFYLGKALGFYTATAIVVFTLVSIYDPAPHSEVKAWIKRILITAGFVAVMYLLFAMLLGVFTPREILFR